MIQKFNWISMLHIFNTNKIVWYILNIDLVNHRAQSWHCEIWKREGDKRMNRMTIIKKSASNKCWRGCEGKRHSCSVDRNVNWNGTIENNLRKSFKTKTKTTIWPNNLLWEAYALRPPVSKRRVPQCSLAHLQHHGHGQSSWPSTDDG